MSRPLFNGTCKFRSPNNSFRIMKLLCSSILITCYLRLDCSRNWVFSFRVACVQMAVIDSFRWDLLLISESPMCYLYAKKSEKKTLSDESLDCHRFRKLVCCGVTKGSSVARNCFRPTTSTSDTHNEAKHKTVCSWDSRPVQVCLMNWKVVYFRASLIKQWVCERRFDRRENHAAEW